jgi:hypothetical protein
MLLLLLWFYWWRAKRIVTYRPTHIIPILTCCIRIRIILDCSTVFVWKFAVRPPSHRVFARTLARGQKSRNNNRVLTTESVHPNATPIRAETHCVVETITVLQRNPVEEIEIFTIPLHMRIRVTSIYKHLTFI